MKSHYLLGLIMIVSVGFAQDDALNKGISYLQEKNYTKALETFNQVFESGQETYDLYYFRSLANLYTKNIEKSVNDISRAIDINPKEPKGYLLRAQIFYAINDKEKACQDAKKAVSLGAESAKQLEKEYCSNHTEVVESLALDWPDEENWQLANRQQEKIMTMLELTRNGETVENWSELGTMISYNGVSGMSMDAAMELFLKTAKQQSPNVKQSLVEKNENTKYPWVIFKMEYAGSKDSSESQLWYVTQGNKTLFAAFRAIRKNEIPNSKLAEWIKFFKNGTIIQSK